MARTVRKVLERGKKSEEKVEKGGNMKGKKAAKTAKQKKEVSAKSSEAVPKGRGRGNVKGKRQNDSVSDSLAESTKRAKTEESVLANRSLEKETEKEADQPSIDDSEIATTLRSKCEWTKKQESTLCEMWEQFPCLYDPQHDEYHDAQVRTDARQTIAAAVNMDGMYN